MKGSTIHSWRSVAVRKGHTLNAKIWKAHRTQVLAYHLSTSYHCCDENLVQNRPRSGQRAGRAAAARAPLVCRPEGAFFASRTIQRGAARVRILHPPTLRRASLYPACPDEGKEHLRRGTIQQDAPVTSASTSSQTAPAARTRRKIPDKTR
jgi:hypothetical protein